MNYIKFSLLFIVIHGVSYEDNRKVAGKIIES